jgi:hypothetical protein
MTDKKICRKLTQKTEDSATQTPLKLQTDMNSDAKYESAVQNRKLDYVIFLPNYLPLMPTRIYFCEINYVNWGK